VRAVGKALAVLLATALALGIAAESNAGCESNGKKDRQTRPMCTDGNGWIIDCPGEK
jgi:hypothetical protein